jgi:kynureninase
MNYENTLEFAREADAEDPLKQFRHRFHIPQHNGKDCIYFMGNSLGLQPKSAGQYVQQELDKWARLGVEGHFQEKNPWLSYHEIFPAQLSKIVGCLPNELIVMNQLTVNLHLLMVSFYRPTNDRFKIICEAKAFPSDQYALESQARFHGFDPEDAIVEVSPRPGEFVIRTEDVLSAIKHHGETVAMVLFGAVNYYTGQYFDLESITRTGQSVGAFVGYDLAHAAGNVELHLHEWNADFGSWCSYKYLNSGPGGVAGAYINERHITNSDLPRFAGWWGHTKETRFQMEKGFEPIPTAEGWQLSNAPILPMAAHKAAVDIFDEAGINNLHQKRIALTGYLHFILNEINNRHKSKQIEIITPANPGERGCQVSMLMMKQGRKFFDELTSRGVIADWREPNVIRVAPVPLYNRFEDIWKFGNLMESMLSDAV